MAAQPTHARPTPGGLSRAVWTALGARLLVAIAVAVASGNARAQEARAPLPSDAAAGWDAALVSRASPGSSAVGVVEGSAPVALLRAALDRLPREPFGGDPLWRFDLIRAGSLADSYLLSDPEASALGGAAAELLESLRSGPTGYLYQVEVDPAVLAQPGALAALEAAGMRAFHPQGKRASWSSYEVTLAAYTAPGADSGAAEPPRQAALAPDPDRERFEARLRSLLQPRPLSGAEEARFQELVPELYAHFEDLSQDPAIRELRVDYRRQRWLTAEDRRNLLIIARYSVRSRAELAAIERYMATRPAAARGRSLPAATGSVQIVAPESSPGALRGRLQGLLPDLRSVRPGHATARE